MSKYTLNNIEVDEKDLRQLIKDHKDDLKVVLNYK